MAVPILVYDGHCKVCVRQVENLKLIVGDRVHTESFRNANFFQIHPEFMPDECEKSIQFVAANGARYTGAEAVAHAIAVRWYLRPFMWLYYAPGLRMLWDKFYEYIARNRFRFS